MKQCSTCKQEKDVSQFHKKRNGLQPSCKSCKRIQIREHYRKNKSVYIAKAMAAAQLRHDWIDTLKDKPCTDCGNKFPPCAMDFDHVKGKKAFNIASNHTASLEKLKKELDKCELVCSNCHRVRTHNRALASGSRLGPPKSDDSVRFRTRVPVLPYKHL